jgi:hypothetical protein
MIEEIMSHFVVIIFLCENKLKLHMIVVNNWKFFSYLGEAYHDIIFSLTLLVVANRVFCLKNNQSFGCAHTIISYPLKEMFGSGAADAILDNYTFLAYLHIHIILASPFSDSKIALLPIPEM